MTNLAGYQPMLARVICCHTMGYLLRCTGHVGHSLHTGRHALHLEYGTVTQAAFIYAALLEKTGMHNIA